MRSIALAFAWIGCSLAGAAGPAEPALRRSIPLPGVEGRIDHMVCDPAGARLFVAALGNGSLEVIDLEKGERVKSVGGLKEPQGMAYLPATGRVVVACGGDGTVRAYDAATLEEVKKVDVGDDADNLRFDEKAGRLVVGCGDGAVVMLDPDSLEKTGEIKLPGHPESFQIEPEGARAFVNVPGGFIGGGGDVEVVDLEGKSVTARWTLKNAGRNFPMALDAPGKRLFVGCRRPARLVVMDTDSGEVVALLECVWDADDVFVDAASGRVLVIGGDGAIDVFETEDHRAYTRVASVKTADGARTALLVPESRTLFVAVPKQSGRAAEIREYTLPDGPSPNTGGHP